jgi:nucleotide-binding universal stress UspA family protein
VDTKKLLVVATAPVDPGQLREAVRGRSGADAEIRIVAPASDVSPLQWLANDEDSAREEAAAVATEAEGSVAPEAARTETEVGDPDPVQAIEDALRTFAADEVLVVTHRDEEAGWLEEGSAEAARERFGVPVTRLTL